ncbi:MAG: hypothetical protein ACXVAR_05740 [Vulcanimicrobiaceae bacterium]
MSAAIVTATRSLKWCGTTNFSMRNVMTTKMARKSSSQPISAPIDDGRFRTR